MTRGADKKKRDIKHRRRGPYKKYNSSNRGPRGPYKKKQTNQVDSSESDHSTSSTKIPEDVQEALDYIFEFDNLDHLSLSDFEYDFEKEIDYFYYTN